MRAALFVLVSLALLVATTPSATADGTWGCHDYEIGVGDWRQGAFVDTDDGAVFVSAGSFYVFSDGDPVRSRHLFSVWVYNESNGIDGPQRGDPVCDDTHGGQFEYDCGIFCI